MALRSIFINSMFVVTGLVIMATGVVGLTSNLSPYATTTDVAVVRFMFFLFAVFGLSLSSLPLWRYQHQ